MSFDSGSNYKYPKDVTGFEPVETIKQGPTSLEDLLREIKVIGHKIDRLSRQQNLEKDYLTTQEACLYLGCSRSMIWKIAKEGRITKLKKENGRTYYATHELRLYIERLI